MKKFRERNRVLLGLIGTSLCALIVLAAYNVDNLRFLAGGRDYEAMFSEAGGLQAGDEVRVGGFPVGSVQSIELEGPGVLVSFTVTNGAVDLAERSTATIKVGTILGDKYLALSSRGAGTLPEGARIPLARTDSPYDLTHVLDTLTSEASQIDVQRVSTALDTVATALRGTRPELGSALRGVGRLSETINSRDRALRRLLDSAEGVSQVLAERSKHLQLLIADSNLLLAELQHRRETIDTLAANVSTMAQQLTGLVADNRAQLEPALQRLNSVLDVLTRNKSNIAQAITGLADYATGLGEAVGSGPFFTAFVQNLTLGNLMPPNVLAPHAPPQGGTR